MSGQVARQPWWAITKQQSISLLDSLFNLAPSHLSPELIAQCDPKESNHLINSNEDSWIVH